MNFTDSNLPIRPSFDKSAYGPSGSTPLKHLSSAGKISDLGKKIVSYDPSAPASITSPKFASVAPEQSFNLTFWKYLAAACAASAAAEALFPISPNGALALTTTASWLLCASTALLLSQITRGSDSLVLKVVCWLYAMMHEIECLVASLCLLPATFFTNFHQSQGDLHGRPILMLNGYLSFGSIWYYLRKRLAVAGCGPIYTMNIGSFDSIAEYATHVQTQVKKIQQETGRKDIVFICHSKGGLVGSYYATRMADSDGARVTDIVTISTPFAGASIAKFGIGQDAKEMHPDHPFLSNLRDEIAKHSEIRFFNIASETDEIVPIKSTLLGEKRSKQRIFKDVGHLGLLYSSKTADQILAWLKV